MLENNLDKPPLFRVGEEVVLQSINYPELNGNAIVQKVDSGYEEGSKKPCYGYVLNIGNPLYPGWAESALRKKHKPSDHSFDSLIAELKSKEPRNAKA